MEVIRLNFSNKVQDLEKSKLKFYDNYKENIS